MTVSRCLYLAALATVLGTIPAPDPLLAKDPSMRLFKVVTVKDEIVIGLTESELADLGSREPGAIGRALRDKGELSAWRFIVRKGKDGVLEQAPANRVSLLRHDTLRIEPYDTPLRMISPD